MKYSTDVALMFGIKEPADNLLVHSEARGKFCARNSGLKHGIAQGCFRGKKRIEGNKGITIRVRGFRYPLTTHEITRYGFSKAVFGFGKGFLTSLSISGRAGEIGKLNKKKTGFIARHIIGKAVGAHLKSSFVSP